MLLKLVDPDPCFAPINLAPVQVFFKELNQRLDVMRCRTEPLKKSYFHRASLTGLNRVVSRQS